MAHAKRLGNIQFFLRSSQKEDNRYIGGQAGVVTYDKDDNYHVSYVEAGFRSDHLVEPIIRRGPTGGSYTSASSPKEYDTDLIRPKTVSVPASDPASSNEQEATA